MQGFSSDAEVLAAIRPQALQNGAAAEPHSPHSTAHAVSWSSIRKKYHGLPARCAVKKEPRSEGLPRVRDPMETSRMQMTSKGAEHRRDGFRTIQQGRQAQSCPALELRGLAIGPDMPPACLCRHEYQLEGTGTADCNITTSGSGPFFLAIHGSARCGHWQREVGRMKR